MAEFNRRLTHLGKLSPEQMPQWWKDLLSLWRPSGVDAGEFGLRLAIRNDYLNFYRRGQSVARVDFGANGNPRATLHNKYVPELSGDDQEYLKLGSDGALRGKLGEKAYSNVDTLKAWISTADEDYAGKEKMAVDAIVAANPNIIDLEMGLPAWEQSSVASRIDFVTLERDDDRRNIVFWEAKLDSDSRIRTSSEFRPNEHPHILKQLHDYRKFLANDSVEGGPQTVSRAYREAARVLSKLREFANGLGESHVLGNEILAAASAEALPGVDPEPRLIVVKDRHANASSAKAWNAHAAKLQSAGVRMQVVDDCGPYLLRRLA